MAKQTKLWTTKGGQRLRVCDMSDDHLTNAIKLVRRGGRSILLKQWMDLLYYLACDPPDGATLAAESECAGLENVMFQTGEDAEGREIDDLIIKHFPLLEDLLTDARRRGLEVV